MMRRIVLGLILALIAVAPASAAVSTIVQPPFTVTTEAELSTAWPDQSIAYAQDTGNTWQLKNGAFIMLSAKSRGQAIVQHSMVTSATALGWQVSATRDTIVRYNVSIAASLSLTTGTSGSVVLEICPTNSTVATDWINISQFDNGNTGTLSIGINTVQTVTGNVGGLVPAGYYSRIRTINNAGTPTFTYKTGQEITL